MVSKIFAVEGTMSIALSLIAFVILTDRPESARLLTEDQKQLPVDHVKSEHLAQPALLNKIDSTKVKRPGRTTIQQQQLLTVPSSSAQARRPHSALCATCRSAPTSFLTRRATSRLVQTLYLVTLAD